MKQPVWLEQSEEEAECSEMKSERKVRPSRVGKEARTDHTREKSAERLSQNLGGLSTCWAGEQDARSEVPAIHLVTS